MSQYVRVYYSILDDERFDGIYSTPHLATWLRLLMQADAMWPASAHVPASERKASIAVLVQHGLVEMLPGGKYRIHGLDAERTRRKDAAAAGGRARQQTLSERLAHAERSVSLAEQSRDEHSKAEQDDGRPDLDAFVAVRYRIPTPAQRSLMDAYVQVFDETGPQRASQLIYAHPDDPIGALKADLAAFRDERRAEAVAAEVPKPRRRHGSGMTGVNAELAAWFRSQDEAAQAGIAAAAEVEVKP
jgi:hypothetical protein